MKWKEIKENQSLLSSTLIFNSNIVASESYTGFNYEIVRLLTFDRDFSKMISFVLIEDL